MRRKLILLFLAMIALLAAVGCNIDGLVQQGRVIGYNKDTKAATLILENGPGTAAMVLPPVVVKAPEDPEEMGPAPSAGKLIKVDLKAHQLVVYDPVAKELRTIDYTPVQEKHNVAKSPGPPKVDKNARTITLYSPSAKTVLTIAATDDMLAMPADTWRFGDVVRYYYKSPGQALRMMNVSKTDLSKS